MPSIKRYLSRLGKKGGKARASKLTPEERIESARKAAQARWARNGERIDKAAAEIKKGTAILRKQERQQHKAKTGKG